MDDKEQGERMGSKDGGQRARIDDKEQGWRVGSKDRG